MLRTSDLRLLTTSCSSHYGALCYVKARNRLTEASTSTGSRYMYTCRCPDGFGYENCTAAPGEYHSDGFTYCQLGAHSVEIAAADPGHVLFIDHASYGRPLFASNVDSVREYCPDEAFATDPSDYCVASNTLAAVTYWCQGKEECHFATEFLLDVSNFKSFFLIYQDSGLEHAHRGDFHGAAESCRQHGGAVAFPASDAHMAELVEMLRRSDDAQGFWIDPRVAKEAAVRKTWDGGTEYENQCLVMLPPKKVFGAWHVLVFSDLMMPFSTDLIHTRGQMGPLLPHERRQV